ncbi:MAG TPA: hypothetical protein VJP60_07940, partial [Rhizomicrobium sp.]|nr:hypothetical protein [Rhizomicrobium sp.]
HQPVPHVLRGPAINAENAGQRIAKCQSHRAWRLKSRALCGFAYDVLKPHANGIGENTNLHASESTYAQSTTPDSLQNH